MVHRRLHTPTYTANTPETGRQAVTVGGTSSTSWFRCRVLRPLDDHVVRDGRSPPIQTYRRAQTQLARGDGDAVRPNRGPHAALIPQRHLPAMFQAQRRRYVRRVLSNDRTSSLLTCGGRRVPDARRHRLRPTRLQVVLHLLQPPHHEDRTGDGQTRAGRGQESQRCRRYYGRIPPVRASCEC